MCNCTKEKVSYVCTSRLLMRSPLVTISHCLNNNSGFMWMFVFSQERGREISFRGRKEEKAVGNG